MRWNAQLSPLQRKTPLRPAAAVICDEIAVRGGWVGRRRTQAIFMPALACRPADIGSVTANHPPQGERDVMGGDCANLFARPA